MRRLDRSRTFGAGLVAVLFVGGLLATVSATLTAPQAAADQFAHTPGAGLDGPYLVPSGVSAVEITAVGGTGTDGNAGLEFITDSTTGSVTRRDIPGGAGGRGATV